MPLQKIQFGDVQRLLLSCATPSRRKPAGQKDPSHFELTPRLLSLCILQEKFLLKVHKGGKDDSVDYLKTAATE
jgi:hypothetical protein